MPTVAGPGGSTGRRSSIFYRGLVRVSPTAGAGDVAEALVAYGRAIGLTEDPAVRAFLSGARAGLLA